ncbi:MAG: hypothetical protein ACK4TG_10370, partial [Thermaurantiacus sp.]
MNAPAPIRAATHARRVKPQVHEGFLSHRRFLWAWVALLLSGGAILLYLLDDPWPRPNGGTALGYALGTAGAGLIVWLSLLGFRKRIYSDGTWSLKAWVSAHVWLGLSLAVIATLHTGFQFGWNVHTLAYALMMLVILSGVWGVVQYRRLPRRLSDNRAETSERAMVAALADNGRALAEAAQRLTDREAALVEGAIAGPVVAESLSLRLAGRVVRCGTARALAELGEGCAAEAAVRQLLEARATLLAQMRCNAALKSRLQVWLLVHVPMTA